VRATTGRAKTADGGLAVTIREAPRTPWRVGTTAGARARMGAADNWCGSNRTEFLPTGCAVAKAVALVAAIAPGAERFTYVMLTVLLLMMVVL
jgi:hypothetical protein